MKIIKKAGSTRTWFKQHGRVLGVGRWIPIENFASRKWLVFAAGNCTLVLSVLMMLLAAPESSFAADKLEARIERGKQLFTSAHCIACHTIEGKGGKVGPDLSHEAQKGRSRQWLMTQIRDPAKHNPSTIMPANKELSTQQVNDLADYLLHPSGAADPAGSAGATSGAGALAVPAGNRTNPVPVNAKTIAAGKAIYEGECGPCHGPKGKGNGSASFALQKKVADLSAPVMAEYPDATLYNIIARGYDAMPAYESLLTARQRWEVLNYIRTLGPKPVAAQQQTPAPATVATTNVSGVSNIERGKQLFTSAHCIACHTIEGKGGKVGPDLSHEAQKGRSRQWLMTQIHDPAKHNPSTIMPANKELSTQQLNDLADYLLHP